MKTCDNCVWCKTHIDHQRKTKCLLMYVCTGNVGITIIDDITIADKCDSYDDDSWVK